VSGAAVSVGQFDVFGQESGTAPQFIRHVGLANESRETFDGSPPLDIAHMGPPLSRGPRPDPITVLGTAGLTVDEVRKIQVFVDEQFMEHEADKTRRVGGYVIAPHVKEVTSQDGTVIFRRYNCAGFVIEAYDSADIQLLDTAESSLPPVALPTLGTQYPDMVGHLERPNIRERFGIPGDGPWPIVLAGYVVNALDRSEADIRARPFRATAGDEYFPSRRSANEGGGDPRGPEAGG
jgi:hypothetical protein